MLEFKGFVPAWSGWIELLSVAFLLSYFLNGLFIRLGRRFNVVDRPDETRKVHKEPTPLTGGPSIVLAFAVTILFNFHFSLEMKGVLIGCAIVFLAGFLDDVFGLSARIRLLLQLLASLVVIFFGVSISFVPDFLGGRLTESVITIVWLMGITNAMNFLDGMDGLASGITMICAVFFAFFALRTDQYYLAFLCLSLIGSCAGFFPYNFRRGKSAEAFLGDGGSNFLGFFLASVAVMGDWAKNNPFDLIIPAIIMGVLVFDMTLTTVMRIRTGRVKSISEWIHFTGRDHFHHRLTDMNFSQKGAVVMIFLTCIISGLTAMVLKNAEGVDLFLVLLQAVAFFFLIAYLMLRK